MVLMIGNQEESVMPKGIPNMPNPCAGVPDNPWCAGGKPVG